MGTLTSAQRLAKIKEQFEALAAKLRAPGKALVCDDEVAMTRLLSVILEQADVPHDVVTHPREARTLLEEPHWDLFLVDFNLPDETGLSLLADAVERHSYLAVIMVTAEADAARADAALAAGAEAFVAKPFDVEQVSRLVLDVYRRGRFRRQMISMSEELFSLTEDGMEGSGPSTWDPQVAGVVGAVMDYGVISTPQLIIVDEAVRRELVDGIKGVRIAMCSFDALGVKPYDQADLVLLGDAGSTDALDRARELGEMRNAPPSLLVGENRALEGIVDAIGVGARGFVTRPIEAPEEFRARVDREVRRSHKRRQALRLARRVARQGFVPFQELLADVPDRI